MFKISDVTFMSSKMKIDVNSIELKLNEPTVVKFREDFVSTIEYFIKEIVKLELSDKVYSISSFEETSAEKAINEYAIKVSEKIPDKNSSQVLDTLRHAFASYAFNGLHQLYTRQENECWHPKIILDEVLIPNDIDSLPEILQIYRGCSAGEHENGNYGQAWTTSICRAKDFAYNHYQGQDWFMIEDRIVIEATYSRDNVLFSDQSIEVVVNVSKLGKVNVNKYT